MKENIPSLPCHFVSEQGQVFRKDEYIDGRSGKIFQNERGLGKNYIYLYILIVKVNTHAQRFMYVLKV